MAIEAISKTSFDNIDQIVKEQYNGTIIEKQSFDSIGDWYREIDVSNDLQMLFLRTGSQVMPIPFDQIVGVEHVTIPYDCGQVATHETDTDYGLMALGAVCGWFVLSQKTKTKIKNKVIDIDAVEIKLKNNPTEDKALFICKSDKEALKAVVKINSYRRKYDKDYNKREDTGISVLHIIGFSLLMASPFIAYSVGSWLLFFGLLLITFILCIAGSNSKQKL